ncbi:MAG: type II CAAX endopeptidase family protein [Gaiellaceae bacterium]
MGVAVRGTGRLVAWLTLVGAVALLGYTSRASGTKPAQDALYRYATAAEQGVFFLFVLAVVLVIATGVSKRELLALRRPASWRQAAGIVLAVLIVVYAANAALDPLLHAGREQGLAPKRWEPSHAGAFAANFVVFGLFGPLVEELTFRGEGFGLLAGRLGRPATVIAVGLAFGVWHGLVDALPVLTVFGIGLAYLRSRTDSIYPGMILHAAFNALALGLAVST